jgi:hypothetical protein
MRRDKDTPSKRFQQNNKLNLIYVMQKFQRVLTMHPNHSKGSCSRGAESDRDPTYLHEETAIIESDPVGIEKPRESVVRGISEILGLSPLVSWADRRHGRVPSSSRAIPLSRLLLNRYMMF